MDSKIAYHTKAIKAHSEMIVRHTKKLQEAINTKEQQMKEALKRLADKWSDNLPGKEVAIPKGDKHAEGYRKARYECAKDLRELIKLLEIE